VLEYHNNSPFVPSSSKELLHFIRQTIEVTPHFMISLIYFKQTVEFLHSELIIHCDIKPSNLLVDMGTVTFIDFGLSVSAHLYEIPEGFRGTLEYAAPEVLKEGRTTVKVDAWGLGVVYAELVFG
jgi:serine/threonine protein kinase